MRDRLLRACSDKGLDIQISSEFSGPRSYTFIVLPQRETLVRHVRSKLEDIAVAMGVPGIMMSFIDGVLTLEVPRRPPVFPTLTELLVKYPPGDVGEFIVGVDTKSRPVYANIRELPHVLIGGSTNSGKSVMVHGLISCMIATHSPAELRLILIDTKAVELSKYEGLPHLAAPICYEAAHAAETLFNLVHLMEVRYQKMRSMGIRDAAHRPEEFPLIVVVVEEYADLVMSAQNVEAPLILLGQKSRAASIHIVLATQRPSVKIITGVLKANFPARLALRTISGVDSKVILDSTGAEKLLGAGDALFAHNGVVTRLQCPYTRDEDIAWIKEHYSR